MLQILPTKDSPRHFHVQAGIPSIQPIYDLAYDNSVEAVDVFMRVSRALAGDRISAGQAFDAEASLYDQIENGNEEGVFVECPPFRILVNDCRSCKPFNLN